MNTHQKQSITLNSEVADEYQGLRLDQVLAKLFPDYSRSRLKEWILQGKVSVSGKTNQRPKDKIQGGELIEIHAEIEPELSWEAEQLPLDIVYEDDDLLIINKSENCVVHPAAGHKSGTLVNALLHHCPALQNSPRAGIIHRLDKDTTGLLIVAKTLNAHKILSAELQARKVERVYEAVVHGVLPSGGTVSAPIARHPHDRKRMSVQEHGKEAITHYRVISRFKHHTHLQLKLETGRTHQIRVHMAYLNYPVIGDKTYGGRLRMPPNASREVQELLRSFPRQALHAKRLSFLHPITQQVLEFEIPLPQDMQVLLAALNNQ